MTFWHAVINTISFVLGLYCAFPLNFKYLAGNTEKKMFLKYILKCNKYEDLISLNPHCPQLSNPENYMLQEYSQMWAFAKVSENIYFKSLCLKKNF